MSEALSKTFAMQCGALVRTVVPRRGKPYVQRCDLQSFVAVAYLIDDLRREGGDRCLTSRDMWEKLPDVPRTRASVALDFLKDRGLVHVAGRRWYPASTVTFEHALCEWHALDHATQMED